MGNITVYTWTCITRKANSTTHTKFHSTLDIDGQKIISGK